MMKNHKLIEYARYDNTLVLPIYFTYFVDSITMRKIFVLKSL